MLRTLLALSILGATTPALADGSAADPPAPTTITPTGATVGDELLQVAGSSPRGVAQSYLVLPAGGELAADVKLITSGPLLGGMPLELTDLALFTVRGRHSLDGRFEVAGETTFLAKQPSYTDDKVWQSAAGSVRAAIGDRTALALGVAAGHLIDHTGAWVENTFGVERHKPLTDYMSFDLRGGADLVVVTAEQSTAHVGEVAFQAATQFRDPTGHAGAWLGLSYAVPVTSGGADPTTGMTVDPQPRLDVHLGCVLSPVPDWDVYIDGAIVDRGDLSNPATRLPILDGGFDQRQLTFGVVRHFEPDRSHSRDNNDSDSTVILGAP